MTTIWILLGVFALMMIEYGMWKLTGISLFDIAICFIIKFFKGDI